MRSYLSRSISSLNQNKLRGLLAEVELRNYLGSIGYSDRVSRGGWIARSEGAGQFAHRHVVLFPETMVPSVDYAAARALPAPDIGLHTICATFHQTGILAYFCSARIGRDDDGSSVTWESKQLGLPMDPGYRPFPYSMVGFRARPRAFTFLRYHTDTSPIPDSAIPDEFAKENIRVSFSGQFLAEVSDVDGMLWGKRFTYPLEIKEKTPGADNRLGPYFGIDLGPFAKLAFFAAKRGNLNSIFIVREIDDVTTRSLVQWWYITFEALATFASWTPQSGGPNMLRGESTVVKIPKSEFLPLDKASLDLL